MESRSKKTLSLGVFLAGFAAFGGYLNMDRQLPENNLTGSSKNTREQLISQIDSINLDITELRKGYPSSHPNGVEERIRKLNREMVTLRNQLSALSNNVAANFLEPELDADNHALALSEEEREAEVKVQIEQQLNLYDNVAAQEGIDPEWASKAQADVYQSFHDLSAEGVGVSEVKCHSSFCQAQFSVDSDSNTALEKLQAVSPWEGESFIWIEDIEQGEGVMYLAREGQTLPDTPDAI